MTNSGGKSLDFQVYAGDFRSAVASLIARALAQFSETDMPGLAELDSGGNQKAVDLNARTPLEFKEHVNHSVVAGTAAEHPAAASQDAPSNYADQPRRFNRRHSFHLQRPGEEGRTVSFGLQHGKPHTPLIGLPRQS